MAEALSGKRQQILEYIGECLRERGYPPSVREIGEAVGLTSSATVHTHLAVLQREGYLQRDPTKPRTIQVRYDPSSKLQMSPGRVTHVPLVGEVAAGTGVLAQENIEEIVALPEDFTGTGTLFMLKVRGDSMIDAGIFDGDTVIIRRCDTAEAGTIVVALIDGEEATLKRLRRKGASIALEAANRKYETRIFPPDRVKVQGRLVGLMRTY